MSSDEYPATKPSMSRRSLVAMAALGAIGVETSRSMARQSSSTPVASPAASPTVSPLASPIASPVASPIVLPGGSPIPLLPLELIRDQRPIELSAPERGGDLRLFVRSAELTNFNPASFRQDFQVACGTYDPLVWLDEVTLEPKPCLAESWAWSNNGLTLTFTLRTDVTWQDGTALTATDVAFSLLVYQQDYDSAVSGFFSLVEEFASTDERTVAITFRQVDGSFLFNAGNLFIFQSAQYGFFWSSQRQGERSLNGYNWSTNLPIGTGPWTPAAASDTEIIFNRNAAYWAGPAHTDRLVLTAEDDITNRIEAWKRDEIDLVWPIPPRETTDLVQEKGRLYAADTLKTMFAAFNFNNPVRHDPNLLSSIEFRQALLLAVDREAYRQSIFGSFMDTTKAGSIAQPWARDERIVNPERNVPLANRFLDSLGWLDNDGDGIRETLAGDALGLTAIVQVEAQPELIAILQLLDRNFREIGVSLSLAVLEPDAWTDRWANTHEFDLIAYDLLQYGAFDEFELYGSDWDIRANRAGWNPGGYANEAVDAALAEWFTAYEISDMQVALFKLQRAVTDDPFGLYFGFTQDPVLVRPGVLGYRPNKMWQSWNTRSMWKSGLNAT